MIALGRIASSTARCRALSVIRVKHLSRSNCSHITGLLTVDQILSGSRASLTAVRSFSASSAFFSTKGEGTASTATTASSDASESATTTIGSSSSVSGEVSGSLTADAIPDRPVSPLSYENLSELISSNPSLQELGLCSFWPSGRFQWIIETLHVDLGLSWCSSIVALTLCIRLLMFPVVVVSQRNAAQMGKIGPQMAKIQQEMRVARKRGDTMGVMRKTQEMGELRKNSGVSGLRSIMPPFIQLPVFLSMFVALRQMTNLPVPSMIVGGELWFTDLTSADPYMVLPIVTSMTTFLQFKFAVDGMIIQSSSPWAGRFIKVVPVVILLFTYKFPAGLTFYWCTTNLISLVQAIIVRQPVVRRRLGIPEVPKPESKVDKDAKPKKGFVDDIRETMDDFKVQREILDRRAYDENVFKSAGHVRPKATYKFDPTKPIVSKGSYTNRY